MALRPRDKITFQPEAAMSSNLQLEFNGLRRVVGYMRGYPGADLCAKEYATRAEDEDVETQVATVRFVNVMLQSAIASIAMAVAFARFVASFPFCSKKKGWNSTAPENPEALAITATNTA
jgi:hypothetical protein